MKVKEGRFKLNQKGFIFVYLCIWIETGRDYRKLNIICYSERTEII